MKEKTMRVELKTFEGLIRVLKALESRLTDLEKISGHITSIISGLSLRTTALEKQVEEHRKRWLE